MLVSHFDQQRFQKFRSYLLFPSGVGFVQEYQAGSIVDELKKTLALKAVVLRNGQLQEIEAPQVVPGDILQLEEVFISSP